jgi:hypothetical protein
VVHDCDLAGVAVVGFLRAEYGWAKDTEEQPIGDASARSGTAVLAELQQRWGPIPVSLAEALGSHMGDAATRFGGGSKAKAVELPPKVCEALFLPGACVEISSLPGSGAHSVVLQLMCMALSSSSSSSKWLGALETTQAEDWGQLHAPAVAASGVPLDRLLVVRCLRKNIRKMAVRLSAQSFFVALLIDLTAVSNLTEMSVAIRRLAINARNSGCTVFLMTSLRARRPRSLSVAVRAAIRPDQIPGTVKIEMFRHREGRLTPLVASLPIFFSEEHLFSPNGTSASKPKQQKDIFDTDADSAAREQAFTLAESGHHLSQIDPLPVEEKKSSSKDRS